MNGILLYCITTLVFALTNTTFLLAQEKDYLETRIQGQYDLLLFPHYFKKGVASSFYQNGGDKWGKSNWSEFEARKNWFGKTPIDNNQKVGISANFWEKAFDDIKLIQALGCNAHRFSLEWTAIEPEKGQFNEEALDFYSRYIDALIEAGIEPGVTLHHFTHPLWFQQMGAFEKEENIPYFVNFCKKVFDRFGSRVPMWFTINEPGVQSFAGYIIGIFTPGKSFAFKEAGTVLKNLLNAHVAVYKALKTMPHGDKVKIGLVHQLLKSVSYSPGSFLADGLTNFFNFSAANSAILTFLKTGKFSYEAPNVVKIISENQDAPFSYDFIGLNYYSRVVMGNFGPTCYPHEILTEMKYPMYPRGIYEAIAEIAGVNSCVPIYITENGIPDSKDEHRAIFIREYLNAVHAAIEDGYDVRGYYYWSLLDNFEWKYGFDKKFGLYHVDYETQNRTLREGAKVFRDYFAVSEYIPPSPQESFREKIFSMIPAVRYL